MNDRNIEIRLGDLGTPLWVRQSTLDAGEGPIMPEPDHDLTFGLSYAHLFGDGIIRRFNREVGRREDIHIVHSIPDSTEGGGV